VPVTVFLTTVMVWHSSIDYRRLSFYGCLIALSVIIPLSCKAQSQPDRANEFWPALNATFEVGARSRVKAIVEKHNGEDEAFKQWKVGAVFSHRMKRIVKPRQGDIDEENEYNLVVGAGYEFLRTDQNSGTKDEHRILLQLIPKYLLGAGILGQDRSQFEFRWVNGQYDFRYRNKLIIDRPFKIDKFRFSPYASGEVFWDRNHHSWNENQYAFGVQLPYKKTLMLDTFYMRQNCTTCSLDPLNVIGVTLNLYINWPRKK
jgi:Protein of unknown function (DUF2490)